MKKTDVRAGSMLLLSQWDHVLNTRPYASILGTSSCCDQYLEFGLLRRFSTLRTRSRCLTAQRCGIRWAPIQQEAGKDGKLT
jgi:hypothetical protein